MIMQNILILLLTAAVITQMIGNPRGININHQIVSASVTIQGL